MPRQRNSTRDDVDISQRLVPLSPSGRGTASEQVYDMLRTAILSTALTPGMAMSEADIAENLHVSRTPVREAFRRLAAEGLLAVSPQVGTVVKKMSRATLADALFIRESIECAAARLAAKAPLAAREHVRDLLQRQREAVLRGDVEGGLQRDGDLHRALIDLSGHSAAWEPVRQARAHMERVRRMAVPELQGNTKALEQHERIVAALIAGDPDVLAEELRAHIRLIEGFVEDIAGRYPDYFE
ncbi:MULTISPECIES: GntR family transcriptional regulator [unclassified Herbaspirillum]|uniref:GntR family transcriptional regulator n=1 Tax=unclassified Herbaspirillum TaxID=2624150 RepID=UPI00383B46CE